MKLDRLLSGACAAVVASLFVCGCASSTTPANSAAQLAALDGRTGTTELMSAQLAGPAPKVGKAHLDVEDTASGADDELTAPKEARGSDGSRRGGNFGSSK
jgi:hypothetical protein